jgi:hypothetical protein
MKNKNNKKKKYPPQGHILGALLPADGLLESDWILRAET